MRENKQLAILFLVVVLCVPVITLAETITLKSGQKLEGKILEKTDQAIIIEWNGVRLPYTTDEIESIDGVKQVPTSLEQTNVPPKNNPLQEPETANLNSAGEYYNNKEYGIKIWHPKDWEVFDRTMHPEIFKKLLATFSTNNSVDVICALLRGKEWSNTLDSRIIIVVQRLPDNLKDLPAEDLATLMSQNTTQGSFNFNILHGNLTEHPSVVEAGGRKLIRYTGIDKKPNGNKRGWMTYAFVKGVTLYKIIGMGSPETASKDNNVFETIAGSLEVK